MKNMMRLSNEAEMKRRYAINRREGENQDLVEFSVDESQKKEVQQKEVSA